MCVVIWVVVMSLPITVIGIIIIISIFRINVTELLLHAHGRQRRVVWHDLQLYGFLRLLVLANVLHAREGESNDIPLLRTLEEFLRRPCFLQVIVVYEDIAIIIIHDNEPVVLILIEEFKTSHVST